MLISNGQLNLATVGGTATINTSYIRGICRHVVIKPESETTVYDVTIINPVGATIYERNDETGTVSELTAIPVLGIYTVNIIGATNDEDFIVQLICEE